MIRSKQSLACIRPYGENHLVLETMFYPDEVRKVGSTISPKAKLHDNEIKMAVQLVNSLSAKFEPKYTDDYRQAMIDIISAKIEGKK